MLRTAGWLAPLARALSAGFDGGISPSFQCVAAQLLGGWDLTETGLAPASRVELIWTHCPVNSCALNSRTVSPVALSLKMIDTRSPPDLSIGNRWPALRPGSRP